MRQRSIRRKLTRDYLIFMGLHGRGGIAGRLVGREMSTAMVPCAIMTRINHDAGASTMELLQGIETRKSIRGFKPTPVPEETIRNILQLAGRSPSYTNTQPWEVAVVMGRKRDELSTILYDLANSGVRPNPDTVTPASWPAELDRRSKEHGARRFSALGVGREDAALRKELRLMNFQFFGAPCALFLFMDDTLGPWSTLDMGLFAQSLALAAHGMGLGTCLQASLTGYPDAVRDFLGLARTKKLVLGISLGYPDPAAKLNTYQSTRVGVDDFARWWK
jgi:nitroreductase